jgi:hypothetical protein
MFDEKLDSAFENLSYQIDSKEDSGISLSGIGHSSDAIHLGNEVEKLIEFTTKTAFLFFPYEKYAMMLADYLGSAPVQDEIEKTEKPVKSRRVVEVIQEKPSMYQEVVEDGEMEPPFHSEDKGRFLGTIQSSNALSSPMSKTLSSLRASCIPCSIILIICLARVCESIR